MWRMSTFEEFVFAAVVAALVLLLFVVAELIEGRAAW